MHLDKILSKSDSFCCFALYPDFRNVFMLLLEFWDLSNLLNMCFLLSSLFRSLWMKESVSDQFGSGQSDQLYFTIWVP